MAVQLAKAYVQIIPSMRGAQRTIQKELGGTATVSGKAIGAKLGGAITGKVSKTLKTGMVATGVAAGGVLTTALTKGFKRLSAFEQAKKSLEGMKLSAEQIDVVMSNANEAVSGTAFGLDEAATAAKGLVAAGVKPGQDLQRMLGLIGDTAAQSGSSMSEMGVLWQKVAAKGKLQGDEALQMMERGIPVYNLVAEKLGVTTEEAIKLASQGKVSFETFASAMESSFGGSALSMGDTVAGSFANVNAALGRLGQGILQGPFSDLPKFFTGVKDKINAVTPAITDASDRTYKTVKGVWEVLDGKGYSDNLSEVFGDSTHKVLDSVYRLRDNLGTVRESFAGFGAAISRELAPLKTISLDGVLKFVDRLGDFGGKVGTGIARLGTSLAPVIGYLGEASVILGGGLLVSIERLAPSFLELADAVARAGVPMSGLIVPLASLASGILVPVATGTAALADGLSRLPGPVLAAGAGLTMMAFQIGSVGKALGGIKTKSVAGVFETLALKALYAADGVVKLKGGATGLQGVMSVAVGGVKALGGALKGLLVANAPMLAISALVGVIGHFASKSAEAKQFAKEFAGTLDQVTGAATSATRELMASKSAEEGWVGLADKAGVSAATLTEALTGNADAMAQVRSQLEATAALKEEQMTRNGIMAEASTSEAKAAQRLLDVLSEQEGVIRQATGATEDKNRASLTAAELAERQLNTEKEYADFLRGQADAVFAYRDAQDAAADAIERGSEAAKSGTASQRDLNANTRAIAETYVDLARKAAAAGESQEVVQGIIDEGKAAVQKYGAEWGATGDQIAEAASLIEKVPAETLVTVAADTNQVMQDLAGVVLTVSESEGTITINGNTVDAELTVAEAKQKFENDPAVMEILGNADSAEMSLEAFLRQVQASGGFVTIDGEKKPATDALAAVRQAIREGRDSVTIDGKNMPARQALAHIEAKIRQSRPALKITAMDHATSVARNIAAQISQMRTTIKVGATAAAMKMTQADGGVVDFYANGGLREKHVAQIAPAGAMRVWAEPETGGEAYIPLALQKRARSTQILEEVAHRFGYKLAKYANGGVNAHPVELGGAVPANVNVTINVDDLQGIRSIEEFLAALPRWKAMR